MTLICDNMSAMVMKNGWVNAVFVGCDRVAANGDAANKIGTSVVAAVAKRYGVPFYVCAPTSTIDYDFLSASFWLFRLSSLFSPPLSSLFLFPSDFF